jgi:hypothetical protein
MRIIGGHDYYDSALGYGHDPNTLFVRGDVLVSQEDAAKIGIEPAHFNARLLAPGRRTRLGWAYIARYWNRKRPDPVEYRGIVFQLDRLTVVACGWRWQGVRVIESRRVKPLAETVRYFWSAERFVKWFAATGLALDTEHEDTLDRYFGRSELSEKAAAALIERRWTILLHEPGNPSYSHRDGTPWQVDQPVLKTVEFFRAMPPNLMFQEIAMWVGGRLAAPARPMLEISDAVRIAKHGMDKTSFRKPKQSSSGA